MNIINRILHRKAANNETDHTFRKILVCYEAHISFETAFLVHFYDGDNNPFLLEKKGNYLWFYAKQGTVKFRNIKVSPLL